MKNKKPKKDDFLYTGGEPCKPIRFRTLSKEEAEEFLEHFKELKRLGKNITIEKSQRVTEHEYYDFHIQKNEQMENYEECQRLLDIKNSIPYSEEKTRIISIID